MHKNTKSELKAIEIERKYPSFYKLYHQLAKNTTIEKEQNAAFYSYFTNKDFKADDFRELIEFTEHMVIMNGNGVMFDYMFQYLFIPLSVIRIHNKTIINKEIGEVYSIKDSDFLDIMIDLGLFRIDNYDLQQRILSFMESQNNIFIRLSRGWYIGGNDIQTLVKTMEKIIQYGKDKIAV